MKDTAKKRPVTMNIALSEDVVEKKKELLDSNSIRRTGADTSATTDVSPPTYPTVATEQEEASDTHVRVATVMLMRLTALSSAKPVQEGYHGSAHGERGLCLGTSRHPQ